MNDKEIDELSFGKEMDDLSFGKQIVDQIEEVLVNKSKKDTFS